MKINLAELNLSEQPDVLSAGIHHSSSSGGILRGSGSSQSLRGESSSTFPQLNSAPLSPKSAAALKFSMMHASGGGPLGPGGSTPLVATNAAAVVRQRRASLETGKVDVSQVSSLQQWTIMLALQLVVKISPHRFSQDTILNNLSRWTGESSSGKTGGHSRYI